MNINRRRLLWHGMCLFLLGLLTGFVEQKFNNPRMGLAAHLEGVMNGTFLVALGAAWEEVKLAPRQRRCRRLQARAIMACPGKRARSPLALSPSDR